MNYYCLIAGLPDLHAEEFKTISSLSEFKSDFMEQLSDADSRIFKMLFTGYDNDNFLAILGNKEAKLNPLGNIKSEEWLEFFEKMEGEDKIQKSQKIYPHFQKYYLQYKSEKLAEDGSLPKDYLSGLFFDFGMENKNKFLHDWFEFNLNLNNIIVAATCRKHEIDPKDYIVGTNEIANILRKSSARDLGIAGLFDQLDVVLRVVEDNDLLEREKKIDAFKWVWLDDHTFFNYFSVERLMAYMLKVEMMERWKFLSVEKGTQIFRDMLDDLKEGVKFN